MASLTRVFLRLAEHVMSCDDCPSRTGWRQDIEHLPSSGQGFGCRTLNYVKAARRIYPRRAKTDQSLVGERGEAKEDLGLLG